MPIVKKKKKEKKEEEKKQDFYKRHAKDIYIYVSTASAAKL